MQRASHFARLKWASLLFSILFCIPIAVIIAITWLNSTDRIVSFKNLALVASGIFILLFPAIWFLVDYFFGWLKSRQINVKLKDVFLLLLVFAAMIAAVTSGRLKYGSNDLSNSSLYNYRVQITILGQGDVAKDVCILEIKDINGNKIRPENDPQSGFLLTGAWALNKRGCQYYSPVSKAGNIEFFHKGLSGSELQFLFRENSNGGKTLLRINDQHPIEVNLGNEIEGSHLVSVPLQADYGKLLRWNILIASGWTSIFIIFLVMIASIFGYIPIPDGIKNSLTKFRFIFLKYPWVSLILIAAGVLWLLWPPGAYLSPDVGYYLSLAKNLYYGRGYVNPDLSPNIYRGPVFPLLISLSYRVFGEYFRSAIILERIFWALTILISYILAGQLYNHRVGFIASVFVLSSFAINSAFYFVWTDGPLVFMILLMQWMFWQAFSQKRGTRWYVLMGVMMGTAYLLKQTALFIVPLPFLMWMIFSEYRTRQTFRKLIVYGVVFSLFLFGWMGYVYLVGGSPKQVAGDLNIAVSIISRFSSFLNLSQTTPLKPAGANNYSISLPQILSTFYSRDISRFFKIAPIMLFAVGFTFYQVIAKRSKPDIYLSLGLILFSAMIPIQVVANFGYRQNLYFFVIGLICIAAMLERVFGNMSPKIISNLAILTVAACLIFTQTLGGNYGIRQPIPITDPKNLNYFGEYQSLATWVNTHIKPNERVLMDERDGDILHILTDDNRIFEIINNCRGETSFWPAVACTKPYILFWIYNGTTDPDNPRDLLNGISEPSLLSTIQEKNVKYVIVTPRIYSLYNYLKIHPDFEEVAILGRFAIFRVNHEVQPLSSYPQIHWDTCVGDGTSEYLKNLKETNPTRYKARLHNEIGPWMGLSQQDLDAFASWQGCTFQTVFPGEYRLP